MFETAAWDDDDGGGPQLSALTWAAARRECVTQENETNSGSNVKRNDKKLKPGKSKKTKLKQGLNDEQEIKGGCPVVQNESKIKLANTSQKQKKFKKVKKSAVSEVKRKMITSLDSGVDSPGQERPLLQDSVNGGEDVNVGEDEDICPGGEDEQLEPSSSTNVEVGAILKKGIKFSSAEAFLRFIGLPGKGRRGKKRSLEEEEEEGVKEQKSKKAQKRNVEELNVSSVQEETSDEEEGVENVAFKSDTPVKDAGGKDTSLNMGRLKEHLNNQDSKVKEENAVTQLTKSTPTESPLTLSAKQKLAGSRFRFLNEQLYCQEGSASASQFKSDPTLFESYHAGYRIQAKQWPLDPLDLIIAELKKLPKKAVVADFGCGEARLAESVHRATVHSFDLVAANHKVVACDMANVPLESNSVDVAVFCLALMGINTRDFIFEGARVLKVGGTLKIAELESRFQGEQYSVESFIAKVQKFGFKLSAKNLKRDFFYFLDFEKVQDLKKKKKLPDIELKPCLYKKR